MIRVACAIIEKDKKILLAQRSEKMPLPLKWEFPGGKIEPGETPEACLAREMAEEFQVEVSVGRFFGVSLWESGRGCIELLAYVCTWQSGAFVPVVHAAYRWVPLAEVVGYDLAPADVPLAVQLQADGLDR